MESPPLELVTRGSTTHLVPLYSDRALCGVRIGLESHRDSTTLTCRQCAGTPA
jgi:hypothetical protein